MPTLLYETAFVKIDVTDESGKVLFKVLVTTLGDDEVVSIPNANSDPSFGANIVSSAPIRS